MVGKESGEMSWNMGSLRVAAPGESNEYLIVVYAKIPCVYIYIYVCNIYIYMYDDDDDDDDDDDNDTGTTHQDGW